MTVSPLFSRKGVCGIDTCLTKAAIGTDLGAASAASAGGVRPNAITVATAGRARLLNLRISLKSPENSWFTQASLTPSVSRATALAQMACIFDERSLVRLRAEA